MNYTLISRVCRCCAGLWALPVSLSRGLNSYSLAATPGSSAELIAKWQNILQGTRQEGAHGSSKSEVGLHKEQLRQLCQDAIHGMACSCPPCCLYQCNAWPLHIMT